MDVVSGIARHRNLGAGESDSGTFFTIICQEGALTWHSPGTFTLRAKPSMSFRSVFRNIAANWIGLAANVVASFFMAPFVVNQLGATYYGIWALVMQFTGYLYLLDFGVRDSVIKYTAKYRAQAKPAQLNRILSVAFLLYLPVTLGAALISAVAALAFPSWFEIDAGLQREVQIVVLLVGLTIAQSFLFNIFSGVLQGLQRFDIPNAIGLAFGAIRIAATIVVLKSGMGVVGLSVVQLAIALMNGVAEYGFATGLLRRAGMPFRFVRVQRKIRRALMRQMFGYSAYVFINNIGQKVILASSVMVVGAFLPVASVSFYAIATSLIDYLRSLVVITAQVFNPLASQYSAMRDRAGLQLIMVRGAKLAAVIGLPVTICYITLGRDFIHLWIGESFAAEAAEVLVVLAVAQLFSNPHYTLTSVLYGMSKHRSVAYLRVAEAACNLVLSIILVRKIGLVGAAIGCALPHIINTALVLPGIACRIVGVPLGRYLLSVYGLPLLASVPFALASLLLREQWPATGLAVFFLQVALLMLLYIPPVYLLVLGSEERELLQGKLRTALARG